MNETIALIPKNALDEVRVSLTGYKRFRLVDIRFQNHNNHHFGNVDANQSKQFPFGGVNEQG